ncbi:MAG: alpha/beta fold hydrolase [Opitutaceae bacterium]|nr:alpha/beta fold hydrolase [Opitutaceae bacterium]
MPLILESTYRSPWWISNPHWQTILPNVTRRRLRIEYRRERFELADKDFVDVDWVKSKDRTPRSRCCIVIHGLEGNSQAPYVKAMARAFDRSHYAVGALNLRGCSGEPNRLEKFYHSGDTVGLSEVLERVAERYSEVYVVGFSLGANVALKYFGEAALRLPESVRAVAAFSVPCELKGASDRLAERGNRFYMKRFIRLLCSKLQDKKSRYPDFRYAKGCSEMKTFYDFDGTYTAPLNGFRDAVDYWTQSSCTRFLDKIDRPALIVNAKNDPFLSEDCYPIEIALAHKWLHLETPESGGHCGFPGKGNSGGYWHELRALAFFESVRAQF